MAGKPFVIAFTGTQQGLTLAQREALANYLETLDGSELEFHHGDCIGADATAHRMMVRRARVFIHPSTNEKKRAYCKGAFKVYPAKSPLARNPDIIEPASLVVACPKRMHEEQRSGTWATVREAFRRGKNVTVVWPDGRVQTGATLEDLDHA